MSAASNPTTTTPAIVKTVRSTGDERGAARRTLPVADAAGVGTVGKPRGVDETDWAIALSYPIALSHEDQTDSTLVASMNVRPSQLAVVVVASASCMSPRVCLRLDAPTLMGRAPSFIAARRAFNRLLVTRMLNRRLYANGLRFSPSSSPTWFGVPEWSKERTGRSSCNSSEFEEFQDSINLYVCTRQEQFDRNCGPHAVVSWSVA